MTTLTARVRHHTDRVTRWMPLDRAIDIYERLADLGYTRPGEAGDNLAIEIANDEGPTKVVAYGR